MIVKRKRGAIGAARQHKVDAGKNVPIVPWTRMSNSLDAIDTLCVNVGASNKGSIPDTSESVPEDIPSYFQPVQTIEVRRIGQSLWTKPVIVSIV